MSDTETRYVYFACYVGTPRIERYEVLRETNRCVVVNHRGTSARVMKQTPGVVACWSEAEADVFLRETVRGRIERHEKELAAYRAQLATPIPVKDMSEPWPDRGPLVVD